MKQIVALQQMLTTKSLDTMKPATVKWYEVQDAKAPGLHVSVSTTGARMFYTMSRANSKPRRIKIGPYPVRRNRSLMAKTCTTKK
jgi:hypothetical protein|tara:strand:- start:3579 stop:3833 length:255 start_codon:yes stop_codon:yes gene_type:complete